MPSKWNENICCNLLHTVYAVSFKLKRTFLWMSCGQMYGYWNVHICACRNSIGALNMPNKRTCCESRQPSVIMGHWTLLSCALSQAVSRQPFTAKVRVWSDASACEIYSGRSGTGTGFVLSTSVVPCQYQCRCSILIYSLTTDATYLQSLNTHLKFERVISLDCDNF